MYSSYRLDIFYRFNNYVISISCIHVVILNSLLDFHVTVGR